MSGEVEALIQQASDKLWATPQDALALADQALAHPALDQVPGRRANVLRLRGLGLSCAGRHGESIKVLQGAAALVPPGDIGLQVRVLRSLAITYEMLGATDVSLSWGMQAVEAARWFGDELLLADCLLTVGVCYSKSGERERGLEQHRQVLPIYQAHGHLIGAITALNNMGIDCKYLGRYDEADVLYQQADELARPLGENTSGLQVRVNWGEVLGLQGRFDESRRMLEAAVGSIAATGNRALEAGARVTFGRMLHAAGDVDAAIVELERALELLDASGSLNHTARAHQTLAALHKGAGRFETALRHQEAFHAAERAQFNQESDNRLRAFQVQFELAEARHEAEMQRIRRLELANAHDELNALHQALQESDREKSRLLVRLSEQSRTDSLTGLANRRHLDERLAEEFPRAARHGHSLSVALCDIDFFKRVNDRFGHGTGDEVLRRVATLLRERCRATDLVARYGGEEFCIVFLETDGTQAARICEEVRAVIEAQDWGRIHPDLVVTLSIGLSDDLAVGQPDRVIAAADTYLYEAKHAGKNRVCWRGATAKKEMPSLPVA